MTDLDPRIRTALVSVNPNSKNPAWHGAPTALGVLRGVRVPAAVWRPYPEANNIREIALHIAFWENSVANRLSGQRVQVGFQQWKTGWVVKKEEISEAEWKDEINLLKAAHQRLVEALIAFDPGLLDLPPASSTGRNTIEFIHGVGEHSLYHTAQIEMIKTLAKESGV